MTNIFVGKPDAKTGGTKVVATTLRFLRQLSRMWRLPITSIDGQAYLQLKTWRQYHRAVECGCAEIHRDKLVELAKLHFVEYDKNPHNV